MWFQQYIVLLRPSPWKHLPLWKQWTESAFQKCGESEVKVWVAQLCPTLCNPMDGGPLGSSVHGIFQARILEWVAIPFSTGSSWPRDQTQVSHFAGRFFTVWSTREAQNGLRSFSLPRPRFCINRWLHPLNDLLQHLSALTVWVPLSHRIYSFWFLRLYFSGFPGGSVVKNLPAKQEMQVRSLGQEDPLEKGMATHSSSLVWKTPGIFGSNMDRGAWQPTDHGLTKESDTI